jgi:ABC-type sugar transport system ATPase subunit
MSAGRENQHSFRPADRDIHIMAKVEFKAVEKKYGNVQAVWPLDLTIESGEFIVLLGPSGCGKTTLLRMIAGLEEVTAGDLLIDDISVNDVPPKDRNVSMVFQNYALYPHLSVAKNLAFPLKARRIDKAEIERRVSEIAEIIGLKELLHRYPKQLSGGQRQRVALGRAMIRNPIVFLFDEPLSNLDASLREEMRSELIQLHARLGKTTIYVTHDQIEAMTMAQKIVLMQNGRIEQVATPRKIYERSANVFVGGFIGSPKMNFVSARIEKVNDVHVLYVADAATSLPKGWKLPEKALSVILGFRPQETRLQNDEPSDLHVLKIPMIVRSLQPLGHDVLINLGSKDDTWTSVAQTSWKKNSVSVGSEVLMHINFSELHFFDAQSKKRINF